MITYTIEECSKIAISFICVGYLLAHLPMMIGAVLHGFVKIYNKI